MVSKIRWIGLILLINVVVTISTTTTTPRNDNDSKEGSCVSTDTDNHDTTDTTDTTDTNDTRIHIRLGLEWFVNPDHLPLIVAQTSGIFTSMGLKVDLVEPTDHWEAQTEIQQGRLDVAVTEPLHLAQDVVAHGESVLGFARFLHTDGGVMYNKRNNITRPADMCGATISYPGSPGPGGPAIVQTMVQADGKTDCPLDSYGKYNGGFFHTKALLEEKADVATLIFWNFEIPEARNKGLDVGFFSLKEWGVPDFCQLVLMTTPAVFDKRKHDFRKLVLAIRKAIGFIHQHPQQAKQYYRDYLQATNPASHMDPLQQVILEETLTATLPAFPNDNMMSYDYYQRLMTWLVETNQVDRQVASHIDPSAYWTNEIAW